MFEQFSKIIIPNPQDISLKDIADYPRKVSTQDIRNAIKNIKIDSQIPEFESIINYICTDFFLYCHQSGLYNRQLKLWKSISLLNSAYQRQLSLGIFTKKPLPIYDLLLKDLNGKSLLFINQISTDALPMIDTPKGANQLFFNFINRLEKICAQHNTICGGFFMIPASSISYFENIFNKFFEISNPISIYESLLPEPLNIPLNVVSIKSYNEFELLIPKISKK